MVVAKQSNYEEFRLKRVEENKKRMEALNLPKLFQNLNPTCVKSSPKKKRSNLRKEEKELVVVRRSSRISNSSSTPVYSEVFVERRHLPRRACKRRNLSNRVYASEESREAAFLKAEEFQADLGNDFPRFIKSMLPSHVSGGFWLGLPLHFCRSHLPKKDVVITLIDEEEEEFETVYLAEKNGLSGGWRGFAVAHDLADGDTLVFQLIHPSTFKVYIIRV